jgi:hypothetical protein
MRSEESYMAPLHNLIDAPPAVVRSRAIARLCWGQAFDQR